MPHSSAARISRRVLTARTLSAAAQGDLVTATAALPALEVAVQRLLDQIAELLRQEG